MDYKKDIEVLLLSLKKAGLHRTDIEEKLGYSENYIDQQLSKGGNKKFLLRLRNLRDELLQKAISSASPRTGADPYLKPYIESLEEQKRILEVQNDFLRRNFETSLNTIAETQHAAHSQLKALSWYQALVAADGDETKAEEALVRMNNKAAWYAGIGAPNRNETEIDKTRKTSR